MKKQFLLFVVAAALLAAGCSTHRFIGKTGCQFVGSINAKDTTGSACIVCDSVTQTDRNIIKWINAHLTTVTF